jgi:predicted phage tail protein
VILRFHGQLAKLYGAQVEMQAESISEAVEGFFRQQPNHPREMLIEVVGYPDAARLNEAPEAVDLMPSLYGGGGKVGSILLGAAMIAAAVAFAPAGGVLAASWATSLAVSGTLMVLQGVMGLFYKPPKKAAEPDPSKYFDAQGGNSIKIGTPWNVCIGEVEVKGHWLSLQSDSDKLAFGTFPASPN